MRSFNKRESDVHSGDGWQGNTWLARNPKAPSWSTVLMPGLGEGIWLPESSETDQSLNSGLTRLCLHHHNGLSRGCCPLSITSSRSLFAPWSGPKAATGTNSNSNTGSALAYSRPGFSTGAVLRNIWRHFCCVDFTGVVTGSAKVEDLDAIKCSTLHKQDSPATADDLVLLTELQGWATHSRWRIHKMHSPGKSLSGLCVPVCPSLSGLTGFFSEVGFPFYGSIITAIFSEVNNLVFHQTFIKIILPTFFSVWFFANEGFLWVGQTEVISTSPTHLFMPWVSPHPISDRDLLTAMANPVNKDCYWLLQPTCLAPSSMPWFNTVVLHELSDCQAVQERAATGSVDNSWKLTGPAGPC